METLEPIIAKHPFFEGLDKHYIEVVTGCASNVRFNPGEYLFKEGEEASQFYVIRHGQVALELFAPPRGPLTIETVGENDILGWSWLFPPYRWHFTAQAVELTRAIAFDGVCLRGKCEQDHDLGYEFLKRFSEIMMHRLQATRLQLIDIYGVKS